MFYYQESIIIYIYRFYPPLLQYFSSNLGKAFIILSINNKTYNLSQILSSTTLSKNIIILLENDYKDIFLNNNSNTNKDLLITNEIPKNVNEEIQTSYSNSSFQSFILNNYDYNIFNKLLLDYSKFTPMLSIIYLF